MGPGLDVIEVGVDQGAAGSAASLVGDHAKQAAIVIEGVEVEDLGVGDDVLVGEGIWLAGATRE